jgi:hypothetical protein
LANLERLRQEKKMLQDRQTIISEWRQATFVVQSPRVTVGIQTGRDGIFRLASIAHYPVTEYVAKVSAHLNIPSITSDERLAGNIANQVSPGGIVGNEEKTKLAKYWRVHKYVPVARDEDAMFVCFKDLETNLHHLGFLLEVKEDSFRYRPVAVADEVVHRSRVVSGTARKGTASRLSAEPQADYLDLAILRIAQKLESEENVPGFLAVAIQVQADDLEEALKLSRRIDDTWTDRFFDYYARAKLEPFRPDQRKEPTRVLRRFAQFLHDEFSSRLSRLQIPIVEREELDSLKDERNRSKTEEFDRRQYTKLTSASHMVIVEVGKPMAGGAFRVSIRLVNVGSGSTLFEDNGDVDRPIVQLADRYFVHAGELAVVRRITATSPTAGKIQKALVLPPVFSAVDPFRLGLVEGISTEDIQFRELFSTDTQALPADQFRAAPVTAPAHVPRDEKLRWFTWHIARSTLPFAGYVTTVNAERVSLNIGANHGFRVGDRFQVTRLSADPADPQREVLPFEIRADVVSQTNSTGFVLGSGLDALWPGSEVQRGDIVVRLGSRSAVVQVQPPRFDETKLSADVAKKIKLMSPPQRNRLAAAINGVANSLANVLTTALQRQGIPTVDPKHGDPSHVVTGTIVPRSGTPDCRDFEIVLETRPAGTDRILQTFGPVALNDEEVRGWSP